MTPDTRELFDLAGTVAVVTEAAQGLGRAINGALGAHGASVVLADRDAGGCEAAAVALREEGIECLAVACEWPMPALSDAWPIFQ